MRFANNQQSMLKLETKSAVRVGWGKKKEVQAARMCVCLLCVRENKEFECVACCAERLNSGEKAQVREETAKVN